MIRKLSLLSFGEEAEEEEKELAAVRQKIKSSHDVLNDPRLLKAETADKEPVMTRCILFRSFTFYLFFSSVLCLKVWKTGYINKSEAALV